MQDWPQLVAKVKQLDQEFKDLPPEAIQSIKAPSLIIIGDSDIVRPEHAVEMFRLLGGGVAGDIVGLPRSQLAVLPGTTHITLVDRADWLVKAAWFKDSERNLLSLAEKPTMLIVSPGGA